MSPSFLCIVRLVCQRVIPRAEIFARIVLAMCAIILSVGCGTPEKTIPEVAAAKSDHWTVSRVVKTENSMVTLFDPNDLVHHEVDPENWHQYDYGFVDDLDSGRFAAVLVKGNGDYKVRVTDGPLTQNEELMAGPRAALRLRVRNDRMLLAGGDAWPSKRQRAAKFAYDSRWIGIASGDYRVLITAMNRRDPIDHHLVFQLTPVSSIKEVVHAPGFPQLIPGKRAQVAGLKAPGYNYREDCTSVPQSAEWTPLSVRRLPLPGDVKTISMSSDYHRRGRALQVNDPDASIPIVVSRNTNVGSAGVLIRPTDWSAAGNDAYKSEVKARILCAVKIQAVHPLQDRYKLTIEAIPTATDRIPKQLSGELTERFANWVRLRNDPAWRFVNGQVRNAVDDQSLVLGIMSYLDLGVKSYEKLLLADNTTRARFLLDMISGNGIAPN